MTREGTIELHLRLVAIVGGLLFLSSTAALFFVASSLGATQEELADNVVPMQRSLGEVSGAVGVMFLRQSEVVAASADRLVQLRDRSAMEAHLRGDLQELQHQLYGPRLRDQPDFPVVEAVGVAPDIEGFLASDSRLYAAAVELRRLDQQLADRMAVTEAALRRFSERASGIAGVLRLDYVASLRELAQELRAGTIRPSLVRDVVLGDARAQLDAIAELDDAVHGLGTLVGKVGLATTNDVVNSLVANELRQNRTHARLAIAHLNYLATQALALDAKASAPPDRAAPTGPRPPGADVQVTRPQIVQRVQALEGLSEGLIREVGDESWPDSLTSLRRRVLAQQAQVTRISAEAAVAASRFDASLTKLRDFSQAVAQRARASASAKVVTTRIVTVGLSVCGLAACIIIGARIRKSVIALRAQNRRLQELSAELGNSNAGLEASVAARTASLQLVLDSTGDGLISVGLDGSLLPERSRAATDWFGPPPGSGKIWDYLSPEDADRRDTVRLGFEQLVDDFLPFEVAASQLPSRLTRDNRMFELKLRDVREGDKLARVLITVQDITAQLEGERAEADTRELHRLVGQLLQHRGDFHQVISECSALVAEAVSSTDSIVVRRVLHTIKGSCAIVGFERMAHFVHELESQLADDARDPTVAEREALRVLWMRSLQNIGAYLQQDEHHRIDVEVGDLVEVIDLARGAGHDAISTILETWQAAPTSGPLARLAGQARNVATRLHKELQVSVDHGRLRVPGDRLREFWTVLAHVIRNAVDHGIEPAEHRRSVGKPAAGSIELSTRSIDGDLVVEVRDDGRGVDWAAVRARAVALGYPHQTRAELVDAMFADGLSTMPEATQLSGRGVGLGAVRAACRSVGGEVELDSEPGQGTRLRFHFPWRTLGSEVRVQGLAGDPLAPQAQAAPH